MSLFRCDQCGCVENTALVSTVDKKAKGETLLCSECDTGTWHGIFKKKSADGKALGADGYLYSSKNPPRHTKIVGIIGQDK